MALNGLERILNYLNQTGRKGLTPRQARRADKKAKRELKFDNRMTDELMEVLGIEKREDRPPAREESDEEIVECTWAKACTYCGADPGVRCVTASGKEAKAPHKERLS